MRRVVVPELLDEDAGTPREIADSLADLRMLNRYFGGISTTVSLLRNVARVRRLKTAAVLDVAGASGDVLVAAKQTLAGEDIKLQPTVLDLKSTHLTKTLPAICGSAFQLPFRDQAFDIVSCSLFVHHLEPPEIETFVKEAMRCCGHAVVINDLRRTSFHLAAATLGRLLYRSRLTRHDAVASVRRAYTPEELRHILPETDYPSVDIAHHYFYRMAIIIWRKAER